MLRGGPEKSRLLGAAFIKAGAQSKVPVFDAAKAIINTHGIDGVHFTAEDHRMLAEAVGDEVVQLLDNQ